nr:alpha-ketoglutarate-dependent dioxygenase AlkB [Sphingomonas arenae]
MSIREEFVTPDEERELIDRICAVELTPFQFRDYEGKRLTHSFGWRYDFQDQSFEQAEPLPAWLHPLRERAAAFAALDPEELGHALLIRYDPGAGIGWHKDRPVFEHVVGVSLGAATVMNFRRREGTRFQRLKLPLAARSAYHLTGEVRHEWEHGIVAHEALRFSITFRSLSQAGRARLHA